MEFILFSPLIQNFCNWLLYSEKIPWFSKKALLNGFVKPQEKSAFMGLDAIIMIGATIASAVVFATFAMSIAEILHSQYINIAFSVPKYVLIDGTPSTLLAIFIMLREGFFEIIFMLAIVIILIFIFTDTTKLTTGKTKNMLFRTIGFAALVLLLPTIWDPVATEIERTSLWLLNPMYSFDPSDPCIPEVTETMAPIAAENQKMVDDIKDANLFAGEASEGFECSPMLRVSYIFEKAIHGASYQEIEDLNWFERDQQRTENSKETIMLDFFGGITKSMMLAFIMMFSTVVMLGKNLWLMSIMALFPMLAGLAIMPYIGDFAQKIIKMIPPLLMCGIITAGVILAGSSGLQMMENQINEGQQLYGIPGFSYGMGGFDDDTPDMQSQGSGSHGKEKIKDISPKNLVDSKPGRMDKGILFWFMAITVLTLAALIPVMMIPELMALSNMAGQMISTGLLSGAMSVASATKGATAGAIGGAGAAFNAAAANGGGLGAGISAALTSPKVLQGMGAGFGAGMGAGLGQDVGAGMSLMPGSGRAVGAASADGQNVLNGMTRNAGSIGNTGSENTSSGGEVEIPKVKSSSSDNSKENSGSSSEIFTR